MRQPSGGRIGTLNDEGAPVAVSPESSSPPRLLGDEPVQDPTEQSLRLVIGERVREARRQQNLTIVGLAERCDLSKGMLSKIENGQTSPSLATLVRLSEALSMPVTAFFRGLDEEHDVLYVKAGTGLDIQHMPDHAGHRYQLLGRMRSPHDRFEPMLITVTERSETFPLYQHSGSEMLYMLAGRMEYGYGRARFALEPGDTLQFLGDVPHGPTALVQLPVQFLAIKSAGQD